MVGTVQTLPETRFRNQRLDPIGLEVIALAELRGRVWRHRLEEPERAGLFLLLIVTAGRGEHVVDFERVPLRAGRVVFVRPGQVQAWRLQSGCEADVLLIEPATLRPSETALQQAAIATLRLEDWPSHFELKPREAAKCNRLVGMLREELDRPLFDAVSAALARELLVCLMLGLSRSATQHLRNPTPQDLLARRFQHELEKAVTNRPSVDLLARRLGVSGSTLTRSCRSRLGQSAKTLVDRRVALEAQRLLVHSTASAGTIGETLGFSEPTNFVKFFRRLVGTTPDAFRRAHRLL